MGCGRRYATARRPASCMPISTRSSPPSSSVTTRDCAAARSSSAAGSCWRPATRPRRTASARRWVVARRSGCAPTRSWCRRGSRRTSRRAARSSRSSTTPPRWSRASRSTRPSSTSAACAVWSGEPETIGAALRRRVRDEVGPADLRRHRTHEVPRQGRERRLQAGRAAARGAGRRAGVPAPAAGRAAVGGRRDHRGQAARRRDPHDRRARPARGARADRRGRPGRGAAPVGAGQPARPAPGRGRSTAQLDRLAVRDRAGRAAQEPRRTSTPCSPGWSTGWRGGCAAASGSDARSPCDCGSTTSSRATRSSTIPRSTASTATWLETGRGLLDVAWPLIEERGCTLLGITISGLVDVTGEEQLELPLFAAEAAAGSIDLALDRVRDRFGSSSVKRAVLVGRHVGLEMPTLPDPGRPHPRLR